VTDRNAMIIEEFREHDGRVSGPFEGAPMLLLHTTGARSGAERINPLMYLPDGERLVVFASKGGAPKNPDWYHNVRTHPEVEVEVGTRRIHARARVARGGERDALYAEQSRRYPQFARYQEAVERTIPVVILEPLPDDPGADPPSSA
jgi:deazaflavin-dependent oxidoreductase (nitroreductase family)